MSLYKELGGIFSIAAVVNTFSDRVLKNSIVGRNSKNRYLREWSRNQSADRLPGLKWMRTLWVADITGGPYGFVSTHGKGKSLNLFEAHRDLHITSLEFDTVAEILYRTMMDFDVSKHAMDQVITAFMSHKKEIARG